MKRIMDNSNDAMNNTQLAIRLIVERFKAAPNSLDLFKAISNMARTSKAYQDALDDLLITLSCRSIRGGGCGFARNKICGYIRTNNIERFLACLQQITQNYHSCIYIPLITKCLVDIVKECTYDFLASYFNFLTTREIFVPCEKFYRYTKSSAGKYPGFKPKDLIDALRISNENGWTDKALLLYRHLISYYACSVNLSSKHNDRTAEKIQEAISKNKKLNFDGQLANRINQAWRSNARWGYGGFYKSDLATLLNDKRVKVSTVPKEVFNLPANQQPWFFGYLTYRQTQDLLSSCTADESFLVTFQGSKLLMHTRYSLPKPFDPNELPRFYLSNTEQPQNGFHIYQFYCDLLNQDLDALISNDDYRYINWTDFMDRYRQPNPMLELLISDATPNMEIVKFLIDIGVPMHLGPWPAGKAVRDDQLPVINMLLSIGATITVELFVELLRKRSFMNVAQMQRLIKAWKFDFHVDPPALMEFIFTEYRNIYPKFSNFTEQKLTVLWIYQYGQSDTCNYLQTLPIELINLIVDLIDDLPLYLQLALMVLNSPTVSPFLTFKYSYARDLPDIGQFMLQVNDQKLNEVIINAFSHSYKTLRPNYHWIRQCCQQKKLDLHHLDVKFRQYVVKYETDISFFRNADQRGNPLRELPLISLFKTKNSAVLLYVLKKCKNSFVMPSRTVFEAQINRPKYKITYEQASAFVDEVKAKQQKS